MKLRFEDAWRADPTVRRAINKKVQFILGKRPISVLDTKKEYTGFEDMKKKAFDKVVGNKEYQDMKTDFDSLNKKIGLRRFLKSALVQCKVLGRSALFVEKDPDGMPAELKLLNCFKLGQVRANNDSWRFESVQYEDNNEPDNILDAQDLLYFTNIDYHISPDTLYYGYSDIEPIAHVSENNRIIDEIDIKEINRGLWASFGVVNFETKNDAEIQTFLRDYKPGTWIGTNLGIKVDVKELKHDLKDLIDERNENEKRILRGVGMPVFMNGFEDVTNRATSLTVAQIWKEGDLEDDRSDLRDQIEPQWCETYVLNYLGIKTEKQLQDLDVKIKMEFEDIVFETLGEKVDALVPLYNLGFIGPERFLKMVGLEDVADEVKTEQEKRLKFIIQQQKELASVGGITAGSGGSGGLGGGAGAGGIVNQDQGRDTGGRFAPKVQTFDQTNKNVEKNKRQLRQQVNNKQTQDTSGGGKPLRVNKPNSDYIGPKKKKK